MLRKVENSQSVPGANHLLMVAFKATTPAVKPDAGERCRFDMFVRLAPGNKSRFKDQQRTWCYRGDKYTNEDPKMLRNLLNMLKSRMQQFDRIVLYDHSKKLDEREILRVIDGVMQVNKINHYALMLGNYSFDQWMTVSI